jgi:hypothetical protein
MGIVLAHADMPPPFLLRYLSGDDVKRDREEKPSHGNDSGHFGHLWPSGNDCLLGVERVFRVPGRTQLA